MIENLEEKIFSIIMKQKYELLNCVKDYIVDDFILSIIENTIIFHDVKKLAVPDILIEVKKILIKNEYD